MLDLTCLVDLPRAGEGWALVLALQNLWACRTLCFRERTPNRTERVKSHDYAHFPNPNTNHHWHPQNLDPHVPGVLAGPIISPCERFWTCALASLSKLGGTRLGALEEVENVPNQQLSLQKLLLDAPLVGPCRADSYAQYYMVTNVVHWEAGNVDLASPFQ